MKKTLPALLLLSCLAAPLRADDAAKAAELLRQNASHTVLILLNKAELSPEEQFWKGRAYIELKQYDAARAALSQVPPSNRLYPYAARGIIYCAWQDPGIPFLATLSPLLQSGCTPVVELAKCAMYEHALLELNRRPSQGDTLPERPELHIPELQRAVRILDIERLRLSGNYEAGIALCRKLESAADYSAAQQQWIRLALAELYYDAEKDRKDRPAPASDNADEASYEGKGEETLLQFIAGKPNSLLLSEAFRRLNRHHAFTESNYALNKLKEWMNDAEQAHRAAVAAMCLQYILTPGEDDAPVDASYANTAHSMYPREPLTAYILLEHVRRLLRQDKVEEAKLYLNMVEGDSARRKFFQAALLGQDAKKRAADFLACAAVANADVKARALANAYVCFQAARDEEGAEQIRRMIATLPEESQAILKNTAAHYLEAKDALPLLQEALSLSKNESRRRDLKMDLALCELILGQEKDAKQLLQSLANSDKTSWKEAQELRYYHLQMELARKQGGEKDALAVAQAAAKSSPHAEVCAGMMIAAADILEKGEQHEEAAAALDRLVLSYPKSKYSALARLHAAWNISCIDSMHALRQAIRRYRDCIEKDEGYALDALYEQCRLLIRIGRGAEAIVKLEKLLKNKEQLHAVQQCHALYLLADAYADSEEKGHEQKAMDAVEAGLQLQGKVPEQWYLRGLMQMGALCSRYKLYEDALEYYRSVLNSLAKAPKNFNRMQRSLYYAAGAAMVQAYLHCGQYRQAAEQAEGIAEQGPDDEASKKPREIFLQWAGQIRQSNFLPPRSSKKKSKAEATQRNPHQYLL